MAGEIKEVQSKHRLGKEELYQKINDSELMLHEYPKLAKQLYILGDKTSARQVSQLHKEHMHQEPEPKQQEDMER